MTKIGFQKFGWDFFRGFSDFPVKIAHISKKIDVSIELFIENPGKCVKFLKNLNQNFENQFLSWKINIFCPGFFSWQGMIILHRKTTPALSLFDL